MHSHVTPGQSWGVWTEGKGRTLRLGLQATKTTITCRHYFFLNVQIHMLNITILVRDQGIRYKISKTRQIDAKISNYIQKITNEKQDTSETK